MNNTPLAVLIPAIESVVFEKQTIDKSHLLSVLNKHFDNYLDSETLDIACDGLQTKYNSHLYGITFRNAPNYVGFFSKDLKDIFTQS